MNFNNEGAASVKKETILIAITSLVLLGLVAYSNCGMQVRPDIGKQNTSSEFINNPDQSLTEIFLQPSISSTQNKPEVVFVLDTSGSMALKVNEIKTSVMGWINQLNAKGISDFCLGAMTAKSAAGQTGLLVSAPGNQKCYCTFGAGAVSSSVAATKFGQNLDAILSTAAGGGAEEAMIYSMHQALNDPAKLAANQAAGCFRNTTTIVPVLVSDEEDVSAAPDSNGYAFNQSKFLPTGQNFSSTRGNAYYNFNDSDEGTIRRDLHCRNGSGSFVMSGGKYVNQIDHETLHQEVVDFNGSFPSFGTSIGFYALNLPAPAIFSEPFWGGMQFAEEFQTEMVDLKDAMDGNQQAFQDQMNAMANSLADSILYFNKFDLDKAICDTNNDGDFKDEDILISINGNPISINVIDISSSGKKIIFNQNYAWSPAASVKITYKPCAEAK